MVRPNGEATETYMVLIMEGVRYILMLTVIWITQCIVQLPYSSSKETNLSSVTTWMNIKTSVSTEAP